MDQSNQGFLIGALLAGPLEVITQRVQEQLAANGMGQLRRSQSEVFRFIPPDGGRVSEVAAAAGMSKQAMGYVIDGLIAQGYLTREPDPTDGRAQIVRRTAQGWSVNRIARDAVADIQTEWENALGQERMALLLDLLRDLGAHLGIVYEGSIPDVSARMHLHSGESGAQRESTP